jgi:cysteine-rich repeat protein
VRPWRGAPPPACCAHAHAPGHAHTWRFLDPEEIPLLLTETAVLMAGDVPSKCRTDCTVPTCGDGILDAGEVCDDGNTTGGDGCSADCTALN